MKTNSVFLSLCEFLSLVLLGLFLLSVSPNAQAQSSMPNGYLSVPSKALRYSGAPPKIEICVSEEKPEGLHLLDFKCAKYAPIGDYLRIKYPGKNVKLTSWEFQCLAVSYSQRKLSSPGCETSVILYYITP